MIGGLGIRIGENVTRRQIKPGTVRRVLAYAGHYRRAIVLLVGMTAVDAAITAFSPLVLRMIVDDGVMPRRLAVVVALAALIAGLALLDAGVLFVQSWYSARLGQGLVYDLRTRVFQHVQRQPLAFFTRTQTGSLVSRLNTDVIGAQQAVTDLGGHQLCPTVLTLTLRARRHVLPVLADHPRGARRRAAVRPGAGKLIGKRMQRLARRGMQLNAEMGSMMNERFNVSGAMLVKLYGRPDEESEHVHRPGGPGP